MIGEPSQDPAGGDVRALLFAYASVLDSATSAPVRQRAAKRLAVDVERQLVEHIRCSLDALARRYRLRAALGETKGEAEHDDARRVGEFAASLPPPPSRLRQLWPVVLTLVLTQLLLASSLPRWLLAWLPTGQEEGSGGQVRDTGPIAEAIRELAKLDLASVGKLATLLFNSDLLLVSLVLMFVCLPGYVVLRPVANGFLVSRRLLADDGVIEREERAFRALDALPPRPRRLDLLVRGLLAAAVLFVALGVFPAYIEGLVNSYTSGSPARAKNAEPVAGVVEVVRHTEYLYVVIGAGTLGAARLAWLAFAHLQRRPIARVAVPGAAVVCLVAGLAGYAASDPLPPNVEVDLPTGLSSIRAGNRDLRVEISCNEPCFLTTAELSAQAGDDPPSRLLEVGSSRSLRRSRHRDLPFAFTEGVRPRESVVVGLSRAQRDWLRQQLIEAEQERPPDSVLLFTVVDHSGNRSRAPIIVF